MPKTNSALSLVPASQSLLKKACSEIVQEFAELGIGHHSIARNGNKLYVAASDLTIEQSDKLKHFLQQNIASKIGLQITNQNSKGNMVSMQFIEP